MFQNADVAGRNYTFDDRWGGLAAVKWTPIEQFHAVRRTTSTPICNSLPDFGVPYNNRCGRTVSLRSAFRATPSTASSIAISRRRRRTSEPSTSEFRVSDALTFINKFRDEKVRPQLYRHDSGAGLQRNGVQYQMATSPIQIRPPGQSDLNPQSRYQVDRRHRRPDRRDVQVQYRAGPEHAGHRRGSSRASTSASTPIAASRRRPSAPARSPTAPVGSVSVLNPPNSLPFRQRDG